MPRKKASAPQRLSEERREEENWDSNQPLGDLINDEVENYRSEEDEDFNPDFEKPIRQKKSASKKGKKSIETDKIGAELRTLLDVSQFCVCVGAQKDQDSDEWKALLGSFELQLKDEFEVDGTKEFWIYLSIVPDMSFLYLDNKRYQRITDVTTTEFQLFKAFEYGNIGAKRRNIILSFDKMEDTKVKINVEVHESTLFKFNHPSDVVTTVPDCVKKAMEYLFDIDKGKVTIVYYNLIIVKFHAFLILIHLGRKVTLCKAVEPRQKSS